MISNIKTVTLRLSQKEFNFLMNGINAKFFMASCPISQHRFLRMKTIQIPN